MNPYARGMEDDQAEVVEFLARADAYPWPVDDVERHSTHGAIVFLAGPYALKIKRAVRFAYMDFSTLDLRRQVLERELAINQPHAPAIYLDLVAVTRESDGRLALAGKGEAVEWALRMRRFEQSSLLADIARREALAPSLCEAVADAIAASHAAAPVVPDAEGPARLVRDAAAIEGAFAAAGSDAVASCALQVAELARHSVALHARLLALRARDGLVRRCHGDLHLANIVLWGGKPTLFDAIEFDEQIATVDVLYDLAFLLMDLEVAGQRAAANRILARWLWRTRRIGDLEALAVLPAMLALRAGIRAMVALQRAGAAGPDVTRYLDGAARFIAPPPPCLVVIGGLSGTGKSTLGAAIAPLFGASPGALHLRSDLQRKALADIEPTDRLPASAYDAHSSAAVYGALIAQARRALAAGHAVIIDAVFADASERARVEALAIELGLPFSGLWLEAPHSALRSRVVARRGDASDATPEVVDAQRGYDTGAITWTRLDASGGPDAVEAAARGALGLPSRSP